MVSRTKKDLWLYVIPFQPESDLRPSKRPVKVSVMTKLHPPVGHTDRPRPSPQCSFTAALPARPRWHLWTNGEPGIRELKRVDSGPKVQTQGPSSQGLLVDWRQGQTGDRAAGLLGCPLSGSQRTRALGWGTRVTGGRTSQGLPGPFRL